MPDQHPLRHHAPPGAAKHESIIRTSTCHHCSYFQFTCLYWTHPNIHIYKRYTTEVGGYSRWVYVYLNVAPNIKTYTTTTHSTTTNVPTLDYSFIISCLRSHQWQHYTYSYKFNRNWSLLLLHFVPIRNGWSRLMLLLLLLKYVLNWYCCCIYILLNQLIPSPL